MKFANLRLDASGARGAFEEFCCQLFRRVPDIPPGSRYRRIRGDGGDGGVEATWTFGRGEVWGLQAKYFGGVGAKEKAQIAESIQQAVSNYPALTRYTICLPIGLTAKKGAKAGKPTQGQHEKLTTWIEEWKAGLASAGRTVAFDIWDESELLGLLAAIDITGGLDRYWFDEEALTPAWFSERLAEAAAQAGRRYSPELAVETPLDEALQAFGRSELWIKKLKALAKNYADKLDWCRKTAEGKIDLLSGAPPELAGELKALVVIAEQLEPPLNQADEQPALLVEASFRETVLQVVEHGNALEPKLKAALLAKHGENADSPGFRQFRAEYVVDFPMAPLDHVRDLLAVLRDVEALALQPEGQLPAATAMLVRGEAGVGKTHGILDTAARRQAAGLPSIVIFGEDVSNSEPWAALLGKLGLSATLGRDAALDALNAAGEATGFPLVIFIDALNETEPDRARWQSWLPPILEQIKRRPFLKLCVSCREIYVGTVMPDGIAIPSIEHNGFFGREYEAQFAFFQHYGLGVPAEPLFQEEFANPLFLRLVCEALHDIGVQAVPTGREGIRAIINLLLQAKNIRAARISDFDKRENRVGAGTQRLADAMAAARSRTLPLAEARSLVDGTTSALQSKSLFSVMESESLIAIIERPGSGLGAQPEYAVRFTFERVGDHLITESLLADVTDLEVAFGVGGSLHFLIENAEASQLNAGILEALSVQLPETYDTELLDALPALDRSLLWGPFIAGLPWRNPTSVTSRTAQLVREALSSNATASATMEALFALMARPEHPLNAGFLDSLLRRFALLERDPFWSNWLEESYSGWSTVVRPASGVHRLIDAARRGRLDQLPDDVGILWATLLGWFCASPDRRIRDRATMAIVNIFRARPDTIAPLLRRFLEVDDEYISERVLIAAYGALLMNKSASALSAGSRICYDTYFADGTPPLNASLRDHARLIIELAVELGAAPAYLDAAHYRPPYHSPWPIALPTDEEAKPYAEDRNRFPEMNLVQQFGLATGTDFARYIVEPRVSSFDIEAAGLDQRGLCHWFLQQAVDMGYPGPGDMCARFDRLLLSEFGGGRGKPGWAERLGKKYYWIFLRRLIGQIADHANRKTWTSTIAPSDELQGLDLRDIDPTDIRQFLSPPSGNLDWLMPAPYVFRGRDVPEQDEAWVVNDDLTKIEDAIAITDTEGVLWQVLDMSSSWNGKRTDPTQTDTYRHIERSIRTATCAARDLQKVKRAFANQPLDHFNNAPHDYRGYLGEYPHRWPYKKRNYEPLTFKGDDSGITFEYLNLRQLRGGEWEREYTEDGGSPALMMPSAALVEAGDLQWDHCGGWHNAQGDTQVQDPWWWTSDRSDALICRMEYLDGFLENSDRALLFSAFRSRSSPACRVEPVG